MTLTLLNKLRLANLLWFSKPASNRPNYRVIQRHNVRKIVELGIGDASRALHMIEIARQISPGAEIHYVGMDPFEDQSRLGGSGISLKVAYQRLRATGAKVQLVPGIPSEGLIRMANSLGNVDLLILPTEFEESNAKAWHFVPRMLNKHSLVFVEGTSAEGIPSVRLKSHAEIDRAVAATMGRRAA